MASTSSSSVQKSFKYDVFLSFRGEDTRKGFVDHLYHALDQKGIITYKDDEKIQKGERINAQLIRSIKDSRFCIIVFSKNYASSSWCLDELVKIMDCKKTKEQTLYPVFYDVEPTEVRNQTGAFGEAFEKLVDKYEKGSGILFSFFKRFTRKRKRMLEDENEEVARWRSAMKDAAGLAGWELRKNVDGHEAMFIQKVVMDISLKLSFLHWSIDEKLVGMDTRVKYVVSSLETGSEDVRMIGIRGIRGGGKTTLARAVFDHISGWFDGNSFVDNVREVSKGSLFGLKQLQKQVLKDVLNDQNIDVTSISDGKTKMRRMMLSRKALVVLDDVDDINQLEALAGDLTWFTPGSRIIITTRDEQVLIAHGVNIIHDVNLLSHDEAINLFSRHAFKKEIPAQGYEKLSREVVRYAAGLPLTIKVLGSHLCGRVEPEWVDAIKRLKTIPLKETLEKLELSYNGLEDDQKEIFLDVVCILKGVRKERAIRILQGCGFNAQIGLRVLEQKSLIIVEYGYLGFHDHIEEMGWNIVRCLHPNEPSRHSRLWIQEEIKNIFVNESGTVATRSIKMNYMGITPATIMKGLRKMKELRLLYMDEHFSPCFQEDDEVAQYLPDSLQSLCWYEYPFRSLRDTFQANGLVNLQMLHSNISELWEGGERKVLNKLKFLDLSYSKLRTFDLRVTPHLEVLNLKRCKEFVELQLSSECSNLRILNIEGSKVSSLNLETAGHLEELNLEGCNDFVDLHIPVEFPNLKELNLSFSKVSNLNLGTTPNLEKLALQGCTDFVELNMPVECPKLKDLNLSGSKVSSLNLEMAANLEELYLRKCNDFVELSMPAECPKLKDLNLSGSKVSNLNLSTTPNLKKLVLEGCTDFIELCMPVECPKLKYLNLSGSKVSRLNLGMIPHLKKLDLEGCYCLQEILTVVGCLNKLVDLNLSGCLRFDKFVVRNLGKVALKLNVKSVDKCLIHPNSSLPKFQFECIYLGPLPSRSGNLEKLISFGLCACKKLESISASICSLRSLSELTLEGCLPKVPEALYKLKCLDELNLSMNEIKHLPNSICMLKHLKSLELVSCSLLMKLPSDLGRLECLELLNIKDCRSLRDIPSSICNMKCLKTLNLSYCILVEKLPKELGHLECLDELQLIHSTSLRDIPNSICDIKCLTYLDLCNCILVWKLPEELGLLECLKVIDIESTSVRHLPQSIYHLKGLSIFGSRGQLESYGFMSLTKISGDTYYVDL